MGGGHFVLTGIPEPRAGPGPADGAAVELPDSPGSSFQTSAYGGGGTVKSTTLAYGGAGQLFSSMCTVCGGGRSCSMLGVWGGEGFL